MKIERKQSVRKMIDCFTENVNTYNTDEMLLDGTNLFIIKE